MHTIVETPSYLKAAEAIFSPPEREAIAATIAADPECGEVMRAQAVFAKCVLLVAVWASAVAHE